jgi:hypothetical protein
VSIAGVAISRGKGDTGRDTLSGAGVVGRATLSNDDGVVGRAAKDKAGIAEAVGLEVVEVEGLAGADVVANGSSGALVGVVIVMEPSDL